MTENQTLLHINSCNSCVCSAVTTPQCPGIVKLHNISTTLSSNRTQVAVTYNIFNTIINLHRAQT